ncbi:TadE family type IV pilus minor pilin [Cellulomonas sp.]|uniref:TadE family type IV pilus minor pilin n=1 Tax=Cellulomonas sp. TaxID=40001 RepID=UPI001B1010E8|nr:TadE family type IV pilus minor pilin [Cellulomonas sp.]MBO9555462.1 TadE family protein [Cellulomonas sp.]
MTAELAVGLPAVVLVLVMVLVVASAAVTQARCADGARTGARVAALGDDDGAVAAAAHRVAGDDAQVVVTRDAGWVTVRVEAAVGFGGRFGLGRVGSDAVGRAEPGVRAGTP